jgi:hypothetical protein
MSKQYYFVVFYDTESGEWSSDPEREDAVFRDDRVWDTETEMWDRGEFEEGTEADEIATKLDELLKK